MIRDPRIALGTRQVPRPLEGRRIVVDPGHGGDDPGAVGPSRVQEKDVTLAVCLELRRRLQDLGAQVRMTRTTDDSVAAPGAPADVELAARVAVANRWPADLFVSVHGNSFIRSEKRGTESYHAREASPDARRLARDIHHHMVEDAGLVDSGVRQADFYVLTRTRMPATLVELAYLSNREDEALLADPAFQVKAAGAISAGVADFLAEQSAAAEGYLLAC